MRVLYRTGLKPGKIGQYLLQGDPQGWGFLSGGGLDDSLIQRRVAVREDVSKGDHHRAFRDFLKDIWSHFA